MSFVYPILEVAQTDGPVKGGGPVLETFLAFYDFVGVPFTLGYLFVGVAFGFVNRAQSLDLPS